MQRTEWRISYGKATPTLEHFQNCDRRAQKFHYATSECDRQILLTVGF
ncbi:MAG: hypothetical protein HC890_19040 [Chloroflexaceae bacterium]|nr:hypothetical protein [Chloroflexaceae bacterium]